MERSRSAGPDGGRDWWEVVICWRYRQNDGLIDWKGGMEVKWESGGIPRYLAWANGGRVAIDRAGKDSAGQVWEECRSLVLEVLEIYGI